jgi:putative oxidoreductase
MLDTPARFHAPAMGDVQAPWIDRAADAGHDSVLLASRLLLGVIFVISGYGKLTGLEGFAVSLAQQGVPMTSILAPLGAATEFFGGLALVLGIGTRYAALVMVGFTVTATLISHRYWDASEAAARAQQTQFFKNAAIAGGFLAVFVAGAGRWSIDGVLRRLRRA